MGPAEVEAILGPPHEVLTADSEAKSEDSEFYKPSPGDLVKKVWLYEGLLQQSGRSITIFNVRFGEADDGVIGMGTGGHSNRSYPWRLWRWARKTFGI